MWQEAIEQVDHWGHSAVAQANVKAKWQCPDMALVWDSLAHLSNISSLYPGSDSNAKVLWSPGEFYCSLNPASLSSSWQQLFHVPLSIAQSIAYKFVQFLEGAATTRIWLHCCDQTIRWE